MLKVLHLLSDHAFVEGHIYRFKDAGFDNTFIFITQRGNYTGEYVSRIQQVAPLSAEYENLPAIASGFDVVFVYNLDYLKSCIIDRIGKDVIVIWYFYGTELYNEIPSLKYSIYSKETKRILGINDLTVFADKTKRIASILKYKMLNREATYTVIARAMQRVNYFTTFSKEEYDYLQAHAKFKMPAFLRLPIYTSDVQKNDIQKSSNALLLGHSATPDANHADIIDLLADCSYAGKLVVPLSYGENKKYTAVIRQKLLRSGMQVEILETFLDRNKYVEKMGTCGAAVFNSYRQMALGNIFLSLRNNLKIYLNDFNPTYKWLLNCGFVIFSVQQDLERDVKNNSLILSLHETAVNTIAYEKMSDPQNNRVYLNKIKDIGEQRQKGYQ